MRDLTPAEARQLTDRMRAGAADVLGLIAEAFTGRADAALGYASWDRYCYAEVPAIRWHSDAERRAAVARLTGQMSNRAMSHALGVDESTVRKDLARLEQSAGLPADCSIAKRGRDGAQVGARGGARCKPIAVTARVTVSPYHYARQAAAIVAEIDREDYQPGDLTAPQLGAVKMLRDALAEFAAIMHAEETAQDEERGR